MMSYIESLCSQYKEIFQSMTAVGTSVMCYLSYSNIRFTKKEYNDKSRIQATKNLLYGIIAFERNFILSELRARVFILKTFIVLFCLKDSGKSNHGIISRNMCLDDRFAITNDDETDNLIEEILCPRSCDFNDLFEGYERLLELIKKFFGKQIEEQRTTLNGQKPIGFQYFLRKILFADGFGLGEYCFSSVISNCFDKNKKDDFLKVHELDIQLFGMFVCKKREKLRKGYLEDLYSLFAKYRFYYSLYDKVSKRASKMTEKYHKKGICSKKVRKFWYDDCFYCCFSGFQHDEYVKSLITLIDSDYPCKASLKDRYDKICKILNSDIKDSNVSKIDSDFQATKTYYLPQKNFFRRWLLKRRTKKLLKYNEIEQYNVGIVFDDLFEHCSISNGILEYKIKISDENGSNRKKNETK